VLEQLNQIFIEDIEHLFARGTAAFLIIFGRRETGKTDLGLLIAEMLHELNLLNESNSVKFFAANVPVRDPPFEIKFINNLDDLRLWSRDNHGKKYFLLDELGKAMKKRSPMSSLNNELIDELQTLRKDKISIVATTVNEKYVDNTALGDDVLDGVFRKENPFDPKVATYRDYLEDFSKDYHELPATSLRFDTWDRGKFTEHPVGGRLGFKDKDLELLWNWSKGKSIKDLGIHPQQLNRIARKYVREMLETDSHISHI
jgi:hypothetical protein